MQPLTDAARNVVLPKLSKRPLSPAIGVEVEGIDLSQPLDRTTIEAIRAAWHDHAVLLFRNQTISEDDQARYGGYFGTLTDMSGYAEVPKGFKQKHHPAIIFISNIREDGSLVGTLPDGEVYFHSDRAFTPDPPIATMLYAMEIPRVGGDTLFANMYAAYDALPQAIKDRIEGLRALNVYDLSYSADGAASKRMTTLRSDAPSSLHPMVKIHPATGRKVLFVNRLMTYGIEGLASVESDELLNYLFDHQEQRRFVYKHVWKVGDVLLWDNRCTLHARTDFNASERRLLRRMTVQAA